MATTEQIIKRLGKLQSILLQSNLQQTNQPLYQVINQLIQAIIDSNVGVVEITGGGGGGPLSNQPYLTHQNAQVALPQSRQLLAGDNVTFDDTVPNERTINASGGTGPEWSVLTNGDAVNPELIFAGGDVIMTHVP